MRTTLEIDDDLLSAAKYIARRQRTSAGAVVSRLLRSALTAERASHDVSEAPAVYGFQPFPRRGGVVTNALIDELREQAGDE